MPKSLIEVVNELATVDRGTTIYAVEPWTCESEAIVQVEQDADQMLVVTSDRKFQYFLEVEIATNFVADWESSLTEPPTDVERCNRLIQFAANDA